MCVSGGGGMPYYRGRPAWVQGWALSGGGGGWLCVCVCVCVCLFVFVFVWVRKPKDGAMRSKITPPKQKQIGWVGGLGKTNAPGLYLYTLLPSANLRVLADRTP